MSRSSVKSARHVSSEWQQYPTPVRHRGGCKVSWNYYRLESEARQCARIAVENAVIAQEEGFEFGYCAPGSVRRVRDEFGGMYRGLWEVCLP